MFAEPEIWVLIPFAVFFWLFGRKLWGAIAGLLDGRADAIRIELAEAELLRTQAQAMLADAEQARAAAHAEAADLLRRSHEEAARLTQAAHAEAEAAGRRRERMALDRISAAEKAAIAEVRQTAAELATKAAAQVMAEGLDAKEDARLVDDAIASLPRALRVA